MVIDSHVHIFPEKIAEKAVQSIGSFYNLPMTGNGRISHLLEAMRQANVDKAIVCSVATSIRQVRSINEFIRDTCKAFDKFIGLISLHPDISAEQLRDEIIFAKANNLVGVKLHPDFQQFDIDDPKMNFIYEQLEGVMPVLFHTGDPRYDFSSPLRLARVAKLFPKLKCIAAHMGGYEKWSSIDCFEHTPNVFFDTSSTMFKLSPSNMRGIIDRYGYHRFLWGSDFPMWNMAKELELFDALELPIEARKKMLADNVIKFYNLTDIVNIDA